MAISVNDVEEQMCMSILSGKPVYLQKGKKVNTIYRIDRLTKCGIVVMTLKNLSLIDKASELPSIWIYTQGVRFISIKQLKKYSIYHNMIPDNVLGNLISAN